MTLRSVLHKILFLSLFCLSVTKAEENVLHITAETFKSLIKELRQDLEARKVSGKNRDQIYDVIGGIKMCLPVIRSVIEHRQKHPAKEETRKTSHPSQSSLQAQTINMTLEEFKVIKDELINQLKEGKIAIEDLESAYTMVGTLNLCLPIVKGVSLLVEEIEKEKSSQTSSLSRQQESKPQN